MFSEPLKHRISTIYAASELSAFYRSVSHWHSPSKKSKLPKADHHTLAENEVLELSNSTASSYFAPKGGAIHISGNCDGALQLGGHNELIVNGSINAPSVITADHFSTIFVTGDMNGTIVSRDTAYIWVDGDFNGSLTTGNHDTRLVIEKNLNGNISKSPGVIALMSLIVNGYASHDSLLKIQQLGFTEFRAAIAKSDAPAGIYRPYSEEEVDVDGYCRPFWTVGESLS